MSLLHLGTRLGAGVVLSALVGGCVITRDVHVEHDDLTLEGAVDTVVVDLGAGDLNVFPGDGDQIEIRRTLRYSGQRPDLTATLTDGLLELVVECNEIQFECRADHDVFLPAGASITGGTGAGNITIEGIPGDLTLGTGAGDVVVLDATGSIELETGSGDVLVDHVVGPLALETGSGQIEVRDADSSSATASTGSGDVVLDLVGSPSRVTIDTGSGDVDLAVPVGTYLIRTATGSGDVTILDLDRSSSADRVIDVETGSGDILIHGS